MPAAMVDPGAKGRLGRIGSRTPVPPANDAGLVHSTCVPGVGLLPKNDPAGGTASKVE